MTRKMKNSGIEWIGEIPFDWEITTIKRIFTLFAGATPKSEIPENWDGDIVWITPADYKTIDKYVSQGKRNISEMGLSSCSATLIPCNSIIFSKRAPIGSVVINSVPLCTNQGCISNVPKNGVNTIFYYYVMSIYTEQFELYSAGTTFKEISANNFGNFKIVFPPFYAQQKIANYLDKKCAEIDSLSSDIQSQISILEDYKKSIIFDSLVKGLNGAEVKITDSDVWKTVPELWELKDIKYVFEIVKRIAGKEGYDILSVTQKGLRVKDISSNEGQIAESYSGYQFVYPTDYVMNHMDLLTGWVDCSTMFGVTSPDYRVFRLQDKKNNNLNYFKYLMQCCYMNRIFYSLGQGVSNMGRWRLQTSTFMNFKIPVPSLDEQNQIAEYLERKCKEIDAVISKKQEQLEVLEQYKKSLIYEYVTGKKEVIL